MIDANQLVEWIKTNANDEVRTALERWPELAASPTPMGISLLQFSAYCRNKGAIEILRPLVGEITFFEAASIGELETIQQLAKANSELLNGQGPDGFSGLGLACFFQHPELVQFLLQQGADPNIAAANGIGVYPIHSACAVSDYGITAMLLDGGANPNVKQQRDITPLHSAAHNGQLELAQLLLQHGADISVLTTEGQTPADMAAEAGFEELRNLLLQ